MKEWLVFPINWDLRRQLSRSLGIHPVTAQVLINRNLDNPERARAFLYPRREDLSSPEEWPGMAEALERLIQAVKRREKVLIHGDYDVDGLAAAAIAGEVLQELGLEVEFFLPDRLEDGYGLKGKGVYRARQLGCSLLLTVDCGITSVQEVALARDLGIDVIITDHHQPQGQLPPARAIINPLLKEGLSPLCGAGIAYKLASALARYFHLEEGERWLDLVALATIADSVPLIGENRILAKLGLKALSRSQRPGLCALMEATGIGGTICLPQDVAFLLAPRLNACGRLGDSSPALELLLTPCLQRARELARYVEQQNRERRLWADKVLREAEALAGEAFSRYPHSLVLASSQWHPGVTGIAAAKLADRFKVPVVLLSPWEDRLRGSARSFKGVDLQEAFRRCGSTLLKFGGHAQAGGVELSPSRLEDFAQAFEEAVAEQVKSKVSPPLWVEAEVLLSHLDERLYEEIQAIGPFGEGNPPPLFLYRGGQVVDVAFLGSGSKFLIKIQGEGKRVQAIGSDEELLKGVSPGKRLDLLFRLEQEGGRSGLKLLVEGLRPYSPESINLVQGDRSHPEILPAFLLKEIPPICLFATALGICQSYNGLKRIQGSGPPLIPLGPWVREGELPPAGREKILSCHPFWSQGTETSHPSPYLNDRNRTLPLEGTFQDLFSLLKHLLSRGEAILLYVKKREQLAYRAQWLKERFPKVKVATDTLDGAQGLLLREESLLGNTPLLLAVRDRPPWFFPSSVVVFDYLPSSFEEIELALPPQSGSLPQIYIRTPQGKPKIMDPKRRLMELYRFLEAKTDRGRSLYIFNNKGYHLRWHLAVFEELGLIRVKSQGERLIVALKGGAGQPTLELSRRYQQMEWEFSLFRYLWQILKGRG